MALSGCTRDFVSRRYQNEKEKGEKEKKSHFHIKRGKKSKMFPFFN